MAIIPNTEFLQNRRKQLDLTQRDVAWRIEQLGLNLTDNHYSRIERGIHGYTNIKLETAFGIARALNADLEDCFSAEFENDIHDFSLSPDQRRKLRHESEHVVKETLGKQLKKIRNSKGQSAREVADNLDMHPSYIFQIERGQASMEAMMRVANYFGYDPTPSK